MTAPRTAARSLRAIKTARPQIRAQALRRYATESAPPPSGTSHALVGGVAGGALVFLAGYGYYHFSGAKTAVNSLHQTKAYFDSAAKKLSDATPEPNEAIEWLRSTALTYAAFIPGAKGYVNTAFNDLDAVRSKHGKEVDEIVKKTYEEIKKVSKDKGASTETALKVWEILQSRMKEIGDLAGDAMQDIMDNHPALKEKVGGNIDQLKSLAASAGPEAQKQLDETWSQISGVVASISTKGFTSDTIGEVQKIVQDKVEQLKKLSNQAFQKGMEQAKPYLDKNPKIKEIVEKNKDTLMQGDVGKLWEMVKSAASSGNTDDLEKFAKETADKAQKQGSSMAKSMGVDVDKYMNMLPGGSEVWGKIQQLQEVSQKHGKEAEDLLKSTIQEIKEVLEKKVGDAEKIADKAKKNAEK